MNNKTIKFNITSDKPLPDNLQDVIDIVGNMVYNEILTKEYESLQETSDAIGKIFDHAIEAGYDILIVEQIFDQMLSSVEEEINGN